MGQPLKNGIYLQNNPEGGRRPPAGLVKEGDHPGNYWQAEFAELPRQKGTGRFWCWEMAKVPRVTPAGQGKAQEF